MTYLSFLLKFDGFVPFYFLYFYASTSINLEDSEI